MLRKLLQALQSGSQHEMWWSLCGECATACEMRKKWGKEHLIREAGAEYLAESLEKHREATAEQLS